MEITGSGRYWRARLARWPSRSAPQKTTTGPRSVACRWAQLRLPLHARADRARRVPSHDVSRFELAFDGRRDRRHRRRIHPAGHRARRSRPADGRPDVGVDLGNPSPAGAPDQADGSLARRCRQARRTGGHARCQRRRDLRAVRVRRREPAASDVDRSPARHNSGRSSDRSPAACGSSTATRRWLTCRMCGRGFTTHGSARSTAPTHGIGFCSMSAPNHAIRSARRSTSLIVTGTRCTESTNSGTMADLPTS